MIGLLSWAFQSFAIWSLAEPSWQVVTPKRGADKAKVAREVVEWEKKSGPQALVEGGRDRFVREGRLRQRLEHRQEPAGHDRAEKGGKQQVGYFRKSVGLQMRGKQTTKRTQQNEHPSACYNSLQISGT